jgi:hypothetical protein
MSVAVQEQVNIGWRARGRDVLKSNSQPGTFDVQHQRPFIVAITIAAHHQNLRTNRAQFVENVFRAHIAEMPDFVRLAGQAPYIFRQAVMRVRENKDSKSLWSSGVLERARNAFDITKPLPDSITPLLHHAINPRRRR